MAIRRRKRQREGARFQYSAWDGTQQGFSYDADTLFKELTDDLMYHGDLNAALRRLMQQGFEDADGNRAAWWCRLASFHSKGCWSRLKTRTVRSAR